MADLDSRIVYGALCTWWDSIRQAAQLRNGLPCCPYCSGPLFECPSEEDWNAIVEDCERAHAGYTAYITWARGRCFKSWPLARAQYAKERGR